MSPVHNYSRNPLSARTQPCWLNRAARDHTATPSSWRRVDGVEAMIPQGRRRENLIHALGLTSGILKSILGACSNQPVSPVHRDNLFYALSLAENDGISGIFGASGSFGASGILKDGASGACAHIDQWRHVATI